MEDVPGRIEHTVLGPETAWPDVRAALEAAARLGMRACVPPWAVPRAAGETPVALTTVLDFPHGQAAPAPTAAAARAAVAHGAAELDMVVNVGRLQAGEHGAVSERIGRVTEAADCPLKVIVEAPLLDADEKHRLGEIAAAAGADYLKTATGFTDGGATVEDVAVLAEYLPVKASGGIGSWEKAKAMFDAGAQRIGASSGDAIVREWRAGPGSG